MSAIPPVRPAAQPVVLCILDGVGRGRQDAGDAVHLAHTPNLDRLTGPGAACRLLQAHGRAVGLPSNDDMGNSEVGHNAMGAGRVFDQGAKLVEEAIASGNIWTSAAWKDIATTSEEGGTLHLLGLLSDGNVHAHVRHLHAILDRAQAEGRPRLRVHILTDGRDVGGRTALQWVLPLEQRLAEARDAGSDWAIATGGGRMHLTMDRYGADWNMVARGWNTHVHAEGERFASASAAITALYERHPDLDDQWLPAFVVGDYAGMRDGDAVVLTNFRGDRAIEISRAFDDPELAEFERGDRPDVCFAGMMEYDGDLHVPRRFLVTPPAIDDTVSDYLQRAGKRSFVVSETQKFGHVTYFYNGNRSLRPDGETWLEIPSPPGPYNRCPEMAAQAVTDAAVAAIKAGTYDHVRLNLANGDMVGHTGDLAATITAVEVVDRCVGAIEAAVLAVGGVLIVTADHGNADEMFQLDKKGAPLRDGDGQPLARTSHSLNLVPCALVDPSGRWQLTPGNAGLAQLGATVLALCELPEPPDYLPSLVERRP
jgi:2,3-bisphosphoglycerate-independent phosphoglycerate mutase